MLTSQPIPKRLVESKKCTLVCKSFDCVVSERSLKYWRTGIDVLKDLKRYRITHDFWYYSLIQMDKFQTKLYDKKNNQKINRIVYIFNLMRWLKKLNHNDFCVILNCIFQKLVSRSALTRFFFLQILSRFILNILFSRLPLRLKLKRDLRNYIVGRAGVFVKKNSLQLNIEH